MVVDCSTLLGEGLPLRLPLPQTPTPLRTEVGWRLTRATFKKQQLLLLGIDWWQASLKKFLFFKKCAQRQGFSHHHCYPPFHTNITKREKRDPRDLTREHSSGWRLAPMRRNEKKRGPLACPPPARLAGHRRAHRSGCESSSRQWRVQYFACQPTLRA